MNTTKDLWVGKLSEQVIDDRIICISKSMHPTLPSNEIKKLIQQNLFVSAHKQAFIHERERIRAHLATLFRKQKNKSINKQPKIPTLTKYLKLL
jgi:hypothetical protein